MKIVQCDGCQRQVEAELFYGTPPDGWLVLETKGKSGEQHYCSAVCTVRALVPPERERMVECQPPRLTNYQRRGNP